MLCNNKFKWLGFPLDPGNQEDGFSLCGISKIPDKNPLEVYEVIRKWWLLLGLLFNENWCTLSKLNILEKENTWKRQ